MSAAIQMDAGIQQVRHDPQIRTVILKSNAPGIFCAGADLKERKEMTDQEVHTGCAMIISATTFLSMFYTGRTVYGCSTENNSGLV